MDFLHCDSYLNRFYDEYEKYKNLGLIQLRSPGDSDYTNDDDRWIRYTLNKIIHDQFSIYKVLTRTIGVVAHRPSNR